MDIAVLGPRDDDFLERFCVLLLEAILKVSTHLRLRQTCIKRVQVLQHIVIVSNSSQNVQKSLA